MTADASPRPGADARPPATRRLGWMSWLLGLGALATVIAAVLHASEERELVRIVRTARPWWLIAALVLQAATYVAQGETWRVVTRAAGVELPATASWKLSLVKVFLDQALPTAGITGTVVVARAIDQRGVGRAVVMAVVVVGTIAYYGAYVLTLALAVVITIAEGHASPLILATAVSFMVFSVVVTTLVLVLAGHERSRPRWTRRIPLLGTALALLSQADPALARRPGVIARSTSLQIAIVVLDAATLWVLIYALGEVASPSGVFASFLLSSLVRTIAIVPGGLGIFDAASVLTLKLAGVALPVALAATLLFRGICFWLPIVPGLVLARGVRTRT